MADLLAVSFTASRDLDERGQGVALNVMATLPPAGRYITGGAVGGDAFIGRHLHEQYRDGWHTVIVPADRSRVDPWWESCRGVEVLEMLPGTTYADRNALLVELGTMVCGLPAYPEDDPRSKRSGTWQTIRMARRAGKLSRWDCVKPPYAGRIETYPSAFGQAQVNARG